MTSEDAMESYIKGLEDTITKAAKEGIQGRKQKLMAEMKAEMAKIATKALRAVYDPEDAGSSLIALFEGASLAMGLGGIIMPEKDFDELIRDTIKAAKDVQEGGQLHLEHYMAKAGYGASLSPINMDDDTIQ